MKPRKNYGSNPGRRKLERQRAALNLFLEGVKPGPGTDIRPHELEIAIFQERWRLARAAEMLVTELRHFGVTEATELRTKVLEMLREALEGGGSLNEDLIPGEPLVDLPGVFRVAFCSSVPPAGPEAETAIAIVRRTLDHVLGPEHTGQPSRQSN